jgi:hypothetical protein
MEEPNILIKTALNEAVQKVNSGSTPTEALKKVAEDLDLNPNYIQRTGEALNVALHYRHFKTAEDRADEFEIANIPQVIAEVFTLNEKSASEAASDMFVTSAIDEEVFNYNRMLSNPQYKQAFLEIENAEEKHDSFPTRLEAVYEKSAGYVEKLANLVEETEINKVAAELELNAQFSALMNEFRKEASARTSFEEFESQVFAKYGELAVPYLDLLHKAAADEERGVHDKSYMMFEQCKEAALFDRILETSHRLVALEKEAEEASENYKYELAYAKEAYREFRKAGEAGDVHKEVSPAEVSSQEEQTKEGSEDPVLAAVKKKVSDPEFSVAQKYAEDPVAEAVIEKKARFGSDSLGAFLKETFIDSVRSRLGHTQTKPSKPNLTLDNMERKLLLQELMLTDPILSKVNPIKVAKAYEQLLRLSPETSKEKEVVRAQLRAMVASQALSAHDADLMTKLDVDMLKRRIATQAFNSGLTEQFRI